jgi:hypothetical protein
MGRTGEKSNFTETSGKSIPVSQHVAFAKPISQEITENPFADDEKIQLSAKNSL